MWVREGYRGGLVERDAEEEDVKIGEKGGLRHFGDMVQTSFGLICGFVMVNEWFDGGGLEIAWFF